MVLHGITMYNMPLICHIFGQEKLQQILQNGGVSKQHFARLRCRMVGSFTRDLRSISYIYIYIYHTNIQRFKDCWIALKFRA